MAKDKGRLPPFVPLFRATLDSPAWRAMSPGARLLYVAFKGRAPKGRNTAFISYRRARAEVGGAMRAMTEWFAELEHYGFTVMDMPGCLGVDGKGRSHRWRLTELGATRKAALAERSSRQQMTSSNGMERLFKSGGPAAGSKNRIPHPHL
jgi:hypothetical protein